VHLQRGASRAAAIALAVGQWRIGPRLRIHMVDQDGKIAGADAPSVYRLQDQR
jgi:hypothetical protein